MPETSDHRKILLRIPVDIYETIEQEASTECRSVTAQILYWMKQCAQKVKAQRREKDE
jgi:hypothetical protein